MNYPTFLDKYNAPAPAQATTQPDPATPPEQSQESPAPNPWLKALNPWAKEQENPQKASLGGK